MDLRIIPVFTLISGELFKTKRFQNPTYIGDLINNVKVASEYKVDELCILDISSYYGKPDSDPHLLIDSVNLSFLPISIGGNIQTIERAKYFLKNGFDRIILGKKTITHKAIRSISDEFGSQSISTCIDVEKGVILPSRNDFYLDVLEKGEFQAIKKLATQGVGEIVFHDRERDGTRVGLRPIPRLLNAAQDLGLPVTWVGGASSIKEAEETGSSFGLNGVGVGSSYVFYSHDESVLPHYQRGPRGNR